jgi:hypothetical protein
MEAKLVEAAFCNLFTAMYRSLCMEAKFNTSAMCYLLLQKEVLLFSSLLPLSLDAHLGF